VRGTMPVQPSEVWGRLSPGLRSQIAADLTAILQEVVTVHGFQAAVAYIVPERSFYGKLKT
jgi:hypothetical protein